jgi:pimeloyl-ACP methyl ester carboxylesterase
MKFSKVLKIFGISGIFMLSNHLHSFPERVQAQSSSNALVVFVNGSGDCCAGFMNKVIGRIRQEGNTVWTTSYASFRNGSTTEKVPIVNLSTDIDARFIAEATQVINNLPENTPIVLIGHSYGGDSILKVLPLIKRRIQLVVTIDPVGTGGFRQVAKARLVPPTVDYFMNRWQENGLAGDNIVPFDSRISGLIPCSAKVCDQEAQNLARNTDGSEIRVSCQAHEVSCDGWRLPGCNFSGCWKGSNGNKARRMFHNDMPLDDFIQSIVGARILAQLPRSSERLDEIPVPDERKFVKFRNKNWGRCLNMQSTQNQNGGLPNVWECVSHPDQEWKIEDAGNGFVKLRNKNWGRCLNMQSTQNQNGGLPNVWECVSHPDQEWKIEDA